jgi:hypothetical protein
MACKLRRLVARGQDTLHVRTCIGRDPETGARKYRS